jgi:hypothetical protein
LIIDTIEKMDSLLETLDESTLGYGPPIIGDAETVHALEKSRRFFLENPNELIGTYQLEAHFNICVALNIQPEAWEVYETARVFDFPRTRYYIDHRDEIIDTLDQESAFILVKEYAQAYLTWEQALNDKEKLQIIGTDVNNRSILFDFETKLWRRCELHHVKWADGDAAQEKLQKIVAEKNKAPSHAKVIERAEKSVESASKRLKENRTEANKQKYDYAKRWLDKVKQMGSEELQQRKAGYEQYLKNEEQKLKKLVMLPSFRKSLFTILRKAENRVRQNHNIALVGEGWISETELFYRVKQLLPNCEVIHHGKPLWLGRQHLDIWIPSLDIAIEYQGAQHFKAVDFFGGEESFKRNIERDSRKKQLCIDNRIHLVEIRYDDIVSDDELRALLKQ